MKSVVVEASTVAKAIETAWLKADKPEEFFTKVLQEHTSGFLGFGAQKAKIVFFFKNSQKSDSLFPVILKQKEYASFFGNSHLKTPQSLNLIDTELNKNVDLGGQHKKKPHNNQSNKQSPKQNNNTSAHGKTTENQVGNKPVLHKVPHADKNLQSQGVKQINIQHPKATNGASVDKKVATGNQVNKPKMQVSLQAPELKKESVVQKIAPIDTKSAIVQDVTKVLKKIQTQKIVANISRPVHKAMPKQVTAKFESYEDFINSTTGIPAEKTVAPAKTIVVAPNVSSFVKTSEPADEAFDFAQATTEKLAAKVIDTEKEVFLKEELVASAPQVAPVVSQVPVNSTTQRVPLKLKRRPLTTENPGISGITRSLEKKNSDSLSGIVKNDDMHKEEKE
jgi:predicted RNA-binding protein Jag